MAAALVVLSFICAVFFALGLSVKRVRMSVPALAIVLWLSSYHLINGINAVLWAGNVNIHIPVWCDIVTKIVYGIKVAFPCALLCIAVRLELVSSKRKISLDKRVVRNRTIFEFVLCYFVPILYMASHLVVQDRRFDLVSDYGCTASTHPSTVAFLMTWLPPLLLCIMTFIFCSVSIHNSGRLVGVTLNSHLDSRSTMDASQFKRQLSRTMIMAGVLILIALGSVFSLHSFQYYTSWSDVHALMFKIEVLHSPDDITSVQFAWWSVFAESILFILLTLVIGQETRDAGKWVREQVSKKREFPRFVLPVYHKREKSSPVMVASSPSLTKPYLHPLTIELKSGWDDNLLSESQSKRKGFNIKSFPFSPTRSHTSATSEDNTEIATTPERSRTDLPSCDSPTPSHMSISEDDQLFMASTISYLTSPTARTLGIVAPLRVPERAMSPTSRVGLEIPRSPPSTPPPRPSVPLPKSILKPPRSPPKSVVPTDVEEPIHSVLDEAWPVPPESPVPTLSLSKYDLTPNNSRSHSPASSADQDMAFPLRRTTTPPHRRTRPFEGSSISSTAEIVTPPSSPSVKRAALIARPSLRSLNRSWSKERLGQAYSSTEVIHMTIVQETV